MKDERQQIPALEVLRDLGLTLLGSCTVSWGTGRRTRRVLEERDLPGAHGQKGNPNPRREDST